jgi:hypothetical protein
MKRSIAVAAMLFVMPVAAGAKDAIPSLKGTWRGTDKILLFGTTEHLSGSPQNAVVRDLEVTHTVTGQDGRLIWGTTSSANNDSKEPGAVLGQQDHRGRRFRRLLPNHTHVGRPVREMLRPKRHGAAARHRRHLLHDGSGEELARDESPTRECTPLAKAGKLT